MKYRNAEIQICHVLYRPDLDSWQILLVVGNMAYIAEFPGDPELVGIHNLQLYEMGKEYKYDFDWIIDQRDVSMRTSNALLLKLITVIHMEFKIFVEKEE